MTNQTVHVRMGELEERINDFQQRHNINDKSKAIKFIIKTFLDNEEYYINLAIIQMEDEILLLKKANARLNKNDVVSELKEYVFNLLQQGKKPIPIIEGNPAIIQKINMNCTSEWRDQVNNWIEEYIEQNPYVPRGGF